MPTTTNFDPYGPYGPASITNCFTQLWSKLLHGCWKKTLRAGEWVVERIAATHPSRSSHVRSRGLQVVICVSQLGIELQTHWVSPRTHSIPQLQERSHFRLTILLNLWIVVPSLEASWKELVLQHRFQNHLEARPEAEKLHQSGHPKKSGKKQQI